MESFFNRWVSQLRDFYLSLTATKRIFLGLTIVAIATAGFFMTKFAVDTSYSVLYSNLDLEDASLILDKIKEKKIPYNYDPKNGTISIPAEFVYDVRLNLATEGLPGTSSVVGLEVFDKTTFGTNSYVQRINYIRAKEGELTRTLSRLTGVERARVHITVPEKTTFVDDEKPAKASVILKLERGKSLTKNQIMGIQHLLSSAVENLEKENVAVMDQSGKMLTDPSENTEIGVSNNQLEYKTRVEKLYETQIISLLERVVGTGSVEARVSADIDFTKQTTLVEDFDPDKTVVRSKVTTERVNQGSRPSPSGVPGARANLPDAEGNVNPEEVKQSSTGVSETLNNEISKTVKNIFKGQGEVKRLSIAVMVDGTYEDIVNDKGESTGKKFIPLSEETISKYKNMISSAVGAVEGRDTVSIESMQFKTLNLEDETGLLDMEKWKLIRTIIQYSILAALIFLFFIFFVRPFMKWITDNMSEKQQDLLPTTIEELENFDGFEKSIEDLDTSIPMLEEAIDPEKAESELLKEKIMSLIEGDPYKATQAITEWLKKMEKEEEVEKANV